MGGVCAGSRARWAARLDALHTVNRIRAADKIKVSEDPDHLLTQTGLRILRRRQDLGLTQKALAEAVGMAQANIAQIEHGQRNLTLRTLCKLAEALNTTVVDLVGGTPLAAPDRDA